MKHIKKLFLAIVLASLPMCQILGWGQKGHRIVAQVAYDNLTPTAKEKIDKTLGIRGLVYWANWADEIRSDPAFKHCYTWHYQNLDPGLTDEEVAKCLTKHPNRSGNLFNALDSLENVLRSDPYNTDALRFVIHFIGDFYCPMHLARQDDMGGNKVQVKWFKQNSSLHSIWDGTLINNMGYSYTEYAQFLEDTFSGKKNEIEKASNEEMLIKNYRFTQEIYEYLDTWQGNTYEYIYHFTPKLNWQLYTCGIRMAMLLNEIYK